jgi:propanol-preferring alcohol dehydrogenase
MPKSDVHRSDRLLRGVGRLFDPGQIRPGWLRAIVLTESDRGQAMRAMMMEAVGTPLRPVEREDPLPRSGELRLRVEACAVCRTDLHVLDGDLPDPALPLVPGHEIVGIVDRVGAGVDPVRIGRRVGVPWLGHACGSCPYCAEGRENLCDTPVFTGYTRDGGFATHAVADAAFAFNLDPDADRVALAPLLCAGLIGWRSL